MDGSLNSIEKVTKWQQQKKQREVHGFIPVSMLEGKT